MRVGSLVLYFLTAFGGGSNDTMYSSHPVIVSSQQKIWIAFAPSGLVILQVINKSNDSGMSSFKILRDAITCLAAFSPIDLPIKFFRSAPSLLTIPHQATISFIWTAAVASSQACLSHPCLFLSFHLHFKLLEG